MKLHNIRGHKKKLKIGDILAEFKRKLPYALDN